MESTPAFAEPTTSQLWVATGMPSRWASSTATFKSSKERNSLTLRMSQPSCFFRCTALRTSSGVVTMILSRAVREPKASCPVLTPPIARPDIQNPRPANFAQIGPLFLRQGPRAVLIEFDRGAGRYSQMEIELTMKIFQVTMTVDETRQDGLAFDIEHLSAGGNRAFTAA